MQTLLLWWKIQVSGAWQALCLAEHWLLIILIMELAIARKYRQSIRIVTLEGDLINPGGSMTGGAFQEFQQSFKQTP